MICEEKKIKGNGVRMDIQNDYWIDQWQKYEYIANHYRSKEMESIVTYGWNQAIYINIDADCDCKGLIP